MRDAISGKSSAQAHEMFRCIVVNIDCNVIVNKIFEEIVDDIKHLCNGGAVILFLSEKPEHAIDATADSVDHIGEPSAFFDVDSSDVE